MWKRLLCTAILAHASVGVWAAGGSADPYPNKPIRIIDGFPPAGVADYLARVIGPKLTERFGQTVIVENRPGAASHIGAEFVARANPDGYTLMMGVSLPLAAGRSLYPKLGYDLLKDFSFVTMVATGAQVLLAHPSLPAKSVSELVALARSKPKAISYGSAGVGSPGHLGMELLQSRTGMELLHVAYKGAAPTAIALTGGEVQIGFASLIAALPIIQAKRLNALAVASAKRLGTLPEVPTVAESGVPGFDTTLAFGILAPTGTPAAVVKLLNAEIRNILQMGDIRAKFAEQALDAVGGTPDEYRAFMEAETAKWTRVIKDANIPAN
jgi:tripartite-type tricarboxylate transporter receptor subunit TctC